MLCLGLIGKNSVISESCCKGTVFYKEFIGK